VRCRFRSRWVHGRHAADAAIAVHAAIHAAGQRKGAPQGCGDRTASIHARMLGWAGVFTKGPPADRLQPRSKTCKRNKRIDICARAAGQSQVDAAISGSLPDGRSRAGRRALDDAGCIRAIAGIAVAVVPRQAQALLTQSAKGNALSELPRPQRDRCAQRTGDQPSEPGTAVSGRFGATPSTRRETP